MKTEFAYEEITEHYSSEEAEKEFDEELCLGGCEWRVYKARQFEGESLDTSGSSNIKVLWIDSVGAVVIKNNAYSLIVEIPEEGENADIDVETVIDIYYNKPDELEQLSI
jgi:hypothetical protein